jgi:hypothetical protein
MLEPSGHERLPTAAVLGGCGAPAYDAHRVQQLGIQGQGGLEAQVVHPQIAEVVFVGESLQVPQLELADQDFMRLGVEEHSALLMDTVLATANLEAMKVHVLPAECDLQALMKPGESLYRSAPAAGARISGLMPRSTARSCKTPCPDVAAVSIAEAYFGALHTPRNGTLSKQGTTALPCIGDGRQSGTSGSPSILNASPEAATGGGFTLLKTGDRVRIGLKKRTANMLVPDEKLARRRAECEAAGGYPYPPSQTPW